MFDVVRNATKNSKTSKFKNKVEPTKIVATLSPAWQKKQSLLQNQNKHI